jgi:ATP-dependent DNA helicase MPH1
MVHVLLAEDREENNINKADAAHKEVNKTINKGQRYELYGDIYRLLPDNVKPECLEKVVEIEPYEREEKPKRASPKKNDSMPAKRKRNDEVSRNIPDGASTGFVSVRDLLVKAPKRRKTAATMAKNFEKCGQDDETDEDIASGRVFVPAQPASGDKPTSKAKLQKLAVVGKTKAIKPKRPKKKVNGPTPSQFSKQGADDSDDMDIAQGAILPVNITPEPILKPSPQLSPTKPVDASVLELSDSEQGHLSLAEQGSPLLSDDDQDMGWIVHDDDDDDDNTLNFEIIDSPPDSPLIPKRALPSLERMQVGDDSIEISMPQKRHSSSSSKTLVNDSMAEHELVKKRIISKRNFILSSPEILSPPVSPGANLVASGSTSLGTPITSSPVSFPFKIGTSPAPDSKGKDKSSSMLPPPLPSRFLAFPAISENHVPEPSFPIRPAGANITRKRRIISHKNEPASPSFEMPAPSQRRRLHRLESTPPVRKTVESEIKGKSKRTKPSLLSRNPNILFDGEAIHSGDEVSEGRSGTEDDESESDRLFLKDSPATQASQSYDQILAYQQSLLTQAPVKNVGILPMFANRATRHKPFGRINGARSRRILPSSSPPPPDEDLDHYDLDSFVVGDDEEIS